jgi:hypothetical protein
MEKTKDLDGFLDAVAAAFPQRSDFAGALTDYRASRQRLSVRFLNAIAGPSFSVFETRFRHGDTPLMLAIASPRFSQLPEADGAALEMIAQMSARQIEMRRDDGRTALHLAALYDLPAAIGRLASRFHPNDIAATDENGRTALHYAAARGRPEAVMAIARYSGRSALLATDGSGRDAFTLAASLPARHVISDRLAALSYPVPRLPLGL